MPIRVVLADDHPIVLQGMAQILARHSDVELVALCANADEAMAAVSANQPDVLVLDVRMPGKDALVAVRELRQRREKCLVVLLTAGVTDQQLVEAARLGVRGVVLKDATPAALVDCIRTVFGGGTWFNADVMSRASGEAQQRQTAARTTSALLTTRELEVVHMVTDGLRNREIATRLAITEGTVKIHLHNIYEKLGVDGRVQLAMLARSAGLA
jgi:DNA-binding NarL/FixJ family response regulator